jgi:nucleotide-binding universal stress UspA family protein
MPERLRAQLRSTPSLLLDSVPVLAVRVGDPARVIAQVARETGAELIVMGAQRKRSLAPLVGTTAERVIALTRCPVLIVRSKGTLRHDKVIVAADLTPSFKEVLRFADRWSFLDSPRVSVVHAFQSPYQGPLYTERYDLAAARRHITRWKRVAREYLLKKLNSAGGRGGRFDLRIEESLPLRLVRREVRRAVSPLLILGTSEHTVLSRAVRGSLASDALLTLECDVLICPSSTPQSVLH